MIQFLAAVALLAVAALVARWSPLLGGIIVMLPTKAVAYLIVTGAAPAGVRGMLLGAVLITVPFLVGVWLWTEGIFSRG